MTTNNPHAEAIRRQLAHEWDKQQLVRLEESERDLARPPCGDCADGPCDCVRSER